MDGHICQEFDFLHRNPFPQQKCNNIKQLWLTKPLFPYIVMSRCGEYNLRRMLMMAFCSVSDPYLVFLDQKMKKRQQFLIKNHHKMDGKF